MINQFRNKYRFLSNFWLAPVEFEGAVYPSVEHAYQAAKTISQADRLPFWKEFMTPGQAKRRGSLLILRGDWGFIKFRTMQELVRSKFQIPHLKNKLLATGNRVLVEGNNWHDNFWGRCFCKKCGGSGLNQLGRILMDVRDELK